MNRSERTASWNPGDILATASALYRLEGVSRSGRYVAVVNLDSGKETVRISDDFENWSTNDGRR